MPKFNEIKPEHRPYGTAADDDRGTEYVASIHPNQTGGMCMVDIVVLRSGQVITLNDECLVVWPSLQAWEDSFETGDGGAASIDLYALKKQEEYESDDADV